MALKEKKTKKIINSIRNAEMGVFLSLVEKDFKKLIAVAGDHTLVTGGNT